MEGYNVALQVVDETVEHEGFCVNNDEKAEWALKKIIEETAETQRYINVCQTMINEYQLKIQMAEAQLESKTAFFRSQLNQYFEIVPHSKTKTQETYKLPSGTLKKKFPQPEFVRDDEKLVKWLKEHGCTELVKTKELPDWAELKKKVNVSGQSVVTEDGEIVDGITVQERPPVFEIEF